MLNYVPDGLEVDREALYGSHQWGMTWESQTVPDDGLLLKIIAASRTTGTHAGRPMSAGGARQNPTFSPERMSGFCAAS
jgi:hypothetical protein